MSTQSLSAPECADIVEREWSRLPEPVLRTLAFEILDRAVRVSLARCFDEAGRHTVATLLAHVPPIDGAAAWRELIRSTREACAIDPSNDGEMTALAGYRCLAGNLPATLFEKPARAILREVSVGGFILCNMATGSFTEELEAQQSAVARAAHST